jgi:hypothetical protein
LTALLDVTYIGMTYKNMAITGEEVCFMERTLFSPSMLEAFTACKRAYLLAYGGEGEANRAVSARALCKHFILRGLGQINKGAITNASQLQKFMGQQWPIDKLSDQPGGKDSATRAFLFAYKTLLHYAANPYRPAGAQIGAVGLKVRSRVTDTQGSSQLYIEDLFDMVLWHPETKTLELVLFHLKPLRLHDASRPSPATLLRQQLAERLKARWPFEKLVLTMIKVGPGEMRQLSTPLDVGLYQMHWPKVVSDLAEMQGLTEVSGHDDSDCRYCQVLEGQMARQARAKMIESSMHESMIGAPGTDNPDPPVSMSA